MSPARVLVAGVGNVFLGDDGFGVEVARALAGRALPGAVRVVDFGIRGYDLAYALADGCDAAIVVDATPRGRAPGTLYVLEPAAPGALPAAPDPRAALDAHGMQPERVLALARALGDGPKVVRIVGCEPAVLGGEDDDELAMGLSDPVRAAVLPAVELVERLVSELAGGEVSPCTS